MERLEEIAETYEHDYSMLIYHELSAKLFIKTRKPRKANIEVNSSIALCRKTGNIPALIYFYGMRARVEILMGKMDSAVETLSEVEALIRQTDFPPPRNTIRYLMSRFLFDITMLERAIRAGDQQSIGKYAKASEKSGKKAVSLSAKQAGDKTEAYRLMGVRFWLSGSQHKALKWFSKSIEIGKRLGAKVELARTYREVGKRLLEKGSRHNVLASVSAESYLEMAEVLFREMDLMEADLRELRNGVPHHVQTNRTSF
jgi:tetratricopeptide (TPR) repeat protein